MSPRSFLLAGKATPFSWRRPVTAAFLAQLAALVLSVTGVTPAHAQVSPAGAPVSAWSYRTNFSIPDSPAFEMLSVDPSSILRPEAARELALALAQFQGEDGGLSVPRAVAIEFSPGILIQADRLTEQQLSRARAVYNTRVSLAAQRDAESGATTRLALGLRFTFADPGEFKTDDAYAEALGVTALTGQALSIYSTADLRATSAARAAGGSGEDAVTVLTPEEKAQLADIEQEIRRRMADRYWNADRWEVAVAGLGEGADSTGRDMKLGAFSLWTTATHGFGTWGQALLGVRSATRRDPDGGDYMAEGSVSLRFYAGKATAKAFVEAQQGWRDETEPSYFVNSGLELAVNEWLWLDFAAGIERDPEGRTHGTASFRLKSAIPGK